MSDDAQRQCQVLHGGMMALLPVVFWWFLVGMLVKMSPGEWTQESRQLAAGVLAVCCAVQAFGIVKLYRAREGKWDHIGNNALLVIWLAVILLFGHAYFLMMTLYLLFPQL